VLEQFRRAAAERSETTITAPAPVLQPIEGMLIKAILDSREVRDEVLPRVKAKNALARFGAPKIFEVMIALHHQQPDFTYGDIEARLEGKDKALLEAALLADEASEGTPAMEVAHACLRKLDLADRETQRAALRAKIRETERGGDLETALKLTEELRHLDRG